MKSTIREAIRKISVLAFLMTSMFFANGQSKDPAPAWLVSKDVQRIANKSLFEDQELKRSHIQATSTSLTWVVSKGIQRKPSEIAKGNIKSGGVPAWTISKGVGRRD